jgi:hypothetical protein
MELEKDLFSLILPEGLLQYFAINAVHFLGDVATKKMFYQIHLEENNEILVDYDKTQFESKGFTVITIQDFPLRGKAVYLVIKRRRWRNKQNPSEK